MGREDNLRRRAWQGVVIEYYDFISVNNEKLKLPPVSLQEGNTPLIESVSLVKELKEFGFSGKIYFKHEGLNPTSSFKDRGMAVAVTRARDSNAQAIICASTGNTSASASAYGARAKIPVIIVVPEKGVTIGKLVQAIAHGAVMIRVKGNFDSALQLARKVAEDFSLFIVNSINPWRIEGQKTASLEICDALGFAPDYHFIPVGNAGNIYSYWIGYKQYKEIGRIDMLPKMYGFQAEGAAPIVKGHPISDPQTIASAIRIGNPANWERAILAKEESEGIIDTVSDDEILKAYKFMGEKEGIFCELSSAASVAGLIKMVKKKSTQKDAVVVCTLTGHGLKDPQAVIDFIPPKEAIIEPSFKAIKNLIQEIIPQKIEKSQSSALQET